VVADPNASNEIKALSCVLLRRSLTTVSGNDEKTLWETLSAPAKEFLKTHLLAAMANCSVKDITHKLSNLLVEVAGGMYEHEEEAIW
jgi:hypothetical protein